MVDEGIKDLRTRRLCGCLSVVIVDVVQRMMLVLQLEVVPVLAAHKHTGFAVLQLEVVGALEDLRESLPSFEV
ncbi:hypothetical protein D3C75_1253170 [compost metagenome]